MTRIRVAVADASSFVRRAVDRMLAAEPGVVVVGLAKSGAELLDHFEAWRPDVVLLDLAMAGKESLRTIDAVMARRPTPILVLATPSAQDAALTLEALHRGALDFIDKEQYSLIDFERLRAVLIDKIGQLAASGARGHAAAAVGAGANALAAGAGADAASLRRTAWSPEVLLVGASTGGPPAIETILRDLGAGLPLPVVIVQHMPAGFTRSFAERLDATLPIPVREVAHDELLVAGVAYLAPGGLHLRLRRALEGLRAVLSPLPETSAHRPSIDLLFASAAEVVGEWAVAVLLTGMGQDGAAGMVALARAGAFTIAQDEATSVVYGMPRAAVAAGGVREVLPLTAIGGRLRVLATERGAG